MNGGFSYLSILAGTAIELWAHSLFLPGLHQQRYILLRQHETELEEMAVYRTTE